MSTVNRIIILCCFGRGGSSIVWRMIGSSPDVIMTAHEWHVAVFGRHKVIRKALTRVFRILHINSVEPLRRFALKKTLAAASPEDLVTKPDAGACVIKLMDYHLAFSEMIRRSFDQASYVILVRHPYGQCESLMRSGLDMDAACRWYADVAEMMAERAKFGSASIVRFEDVVKSPIEACETLYRELGIGPASDGKFEFKLKPFGSRRTAEVDVAKGEFIRIGASDAGHYIDASVLRGGRDRLSDEQRQLIWKKTGAAAARFGYTEANGF